MFGSTPSPRAVSGISCINPTAPFGDTAAALKPDSARITLATNAEGNAYFRAADAANSAGVKDVASVGAGPVIAGLMDSALATGVGGVGKAASTTGDSTSSIADT